LGDSGACPPRNGRTITICPECRELPVSWWRLPAYSSGKPRRSMQSQNRFQMRGSGKRPWWDWRRFLPAGRSRFALGALIGLPGSLWSPSLFNLNKGASHRPTPMEPVPGGALMMRNIGLFPHSQRLEWVQASAALTTPLQNQLDDNRAGAETVLRTVYPPKGIQSSRTRARRPTSRRAARDRLLGLLRSELLEPFREEIKSSNNARRKIVKIRPNMNAWARAVLVFEDVCWRP